MKVRDRGTVRDVSAGEGNMLHAFREAVEAEAHRLVDQLARDLDIPLPKPTYGKLERQAFFAGARAKLQGLPNECNDARFDTSHARARWHGGWHAVDPNGRLAREGRKMKAAASKRATDLTEKTWQGS